MRKSTFIIGVLVVTLCAYWIYQLRRGLDKAAEMNTKGCLTISYAQLLRYGAFTNPAPDRARIYTYTNDHAIAGTNYRCVLVADSWHRLSTSNLLAISTNGYFLLISKDGVARLAGPVWSYCFPTNNASN